MPISKHVLVVFVLIFCSFALTPAAGAASSLSNSEISLLRAVNTTRLSHGLRPLKIDTHLQTAAKSHSLDMASHSYFDHGPFGSRLMSFGVHARMVGENLAWGYGRYAAARVVVREWLASPEHRANLLRPGFRRVGIGAALGSYGGSTRTKMITADFAGK